MKIIFLDIDGVLNYQGSNLIDDGCLNNLRNIVKQTGAKIVLISTWKTFLDDDILMTLSDKDKESFLEHRALFYSVFKDDLEILDIVEDYFELSKENNKVEKEVLLSDIDDLDDHSNWRSIEINRWLSKNSGIESFVIVDDFNCGYSKYYPNNWVGTYWFGHGLGDIDMEKAIKVLNRMVAV